MPSRISPEAAISEALREEVRSGRATLDRKLAICMEAAVLDPEDRVETLCILAADSDPVVREEAAGIEIGVAEVFEHSAMELVGSRLEDVILNALPFVHGLGAGRFHLELLDGLDGYAEGQIARIGLGPGAG